jgi:hypothetical protein
LPLGVLLLLLVEDDRDAVEAAEGLLLRVEDDDDKEGDELRALLALDFAASAV